ncbi:MAG: hypothetical protein II417_00780 [Elusimicrobia bacterium]|nr:hypothetical protein [Elusimicrobiota bacterium]
MIPKLTDFVLYVNKALNGKAWNTNFQKIINWFTSGETDLNVNKVTTNSVETGTATTNGLNVNGNADIAGNVTVGGVISGDGSGLTGIRSTSTIAYTPFTVNKGYVDTTELSATYGQEILMEKKAGYNNLIEFKVPITATTSDGVTFTLEQLDDCDVADYGDGTYIVCIKKNQQRVEFKEGANGVYRQRLAPTDNSIPNNSLWLNTSTENIQCYEKLNNNWNTKYDGVPIGEVVVASGEITSLKTYHYNWNGYNINVQEKINIAQRPAVIIETWYADNINWNQRQTQTDYYIKYSNGLVIQGGRIAWTSGNTYSGALPTSVTISKVCNVTLTETELNSGSTSSGHITSISGGTVSVVASSVGANAGVMLWEVKGYK